MVRNADGDFISLHLDGLGNIWLSSRLRSAHIPANTHIYAHAGSSACVNGKFYCRNRGYTPQHLNSSMVDDGFCGELALLLWSLTNSCSTGFPSDPGCLTTSDFLRTICCKHICNIKHQQNSNYDQQLPFMWSQRAEDSRVKCPLHPFQAQL